MIEQKHLVLVFSSSYAMNDMVDTDVIRSTQYLFTKLQHHMGYVDADS